MKTTKRVEYSYATSPNAVKFGFGNVGCWTVETVEREPIVKPAKAVAGFTTRHQARDHAETLPHEWDKLTK